MCVCVCLSVCLSVCLCLPVSTVLHYHRARAWQVDRMSLDVQHLISQATLVHTHLSQLEAAVGAPKGGGGQSGAEGGGSKFLGHATPQSTLGPFVTAGMMSTCGQRLDVLTDLLHTQRITRDEFEAKRATILASL